MWRLFLVVKGVIVMNYIKKIIITGFVVVGCWGLISPEYSCTKGGVEILELDNGELEEFQIKLHFWDLLNAQSGEIRIRSKLWELFQLS